MALFNSFPTLLITISYCAIYGRDPPLLVAPEFDHAAVRKTIVAPVLLVLVLVVLCQATRVTSSCSHSFECTKRASRVVFSFVPPAWFVGDHCCRKHSRSKSSSKDRSLSLSLSRTSREILGIHALFSSAETTNTISVKRDKFCNPSIS